MPMLEHPIQLIRQTQVHTTPANRYSVIYGLTFGQVFESPAPLYEFDNLVRCGEGRHPSVQLDVLQRQFNQIRVPWLPGLPKIARPKRPFDLGHHLVIVCLLTCRISEDKRVLRFPPNERFLISQHVAVFPSDDIPVFTYCVIPQFSFD